MAQKYFSIKNAEFLVDKLFFTPEDNWFKKSVDGKLNDDEKELVKTLKLIKDTLLASYQPYFRVDPSKIRHNMIHDVYKYFNE